MLFCAVIVTLSYHPQGGVRGPGVGVGGGEAQARSDKTPWGILEQCADEDSCRDGQRPPGGSTFPAYVLTYVRAGTDPQQSGGRMEKKRPPGKALSPSFCPFLPCGAQHTGRTRARCAGSPGWSGTAGPPRGALGALVPARCAFSPRPPSAPPGKLGSRRRESGTSQALRAAAGRDWGSGGEGERSPRDSSHAAAAAATTCARSPKRTRRSGRC